MTHFSPGLLTQRGSVCAFCCSMVINTPLLIIGLGRSESGARINDKLSAEYFIGAYKQAGSQNSFEAGYFWGCVFFKSDLNSVRNSSSLFKPCFIYSSLNLTVLNGFQDKLKQNF